MRKLEDINDTLQKTFSKDLTLYAYAEYKHMLPYSPTTLKKDKNRMAKRTEGLIQVDGGVLKKQ